MSYKYCPRVLIEGGYYFFTRPSNAGIIRMRVLIEGGSYMRKYGTRNKKNSQKQFSKKKISKKIFNSFFVHSESSDKSLAAAQWVHDRMPGDFIYASTRDDVIVNIERTCDFLAQMIPPMKPPQRVVVTRHKDGRTMISSQEQKIFCFDRYAPDEPVQRDTAKARAVATRAYPADRWPPYCGGALYAMPVTMAGDIFRVSQTVRHRIPAELTDVYVTGILRRLLGRGDGNIVAAGQAELTWTPFERFGSLVDGGDRRMGVGFRGDKISTKVLLRWDELYERLKVRHHVFTRFK